MLEIAGILALLVLYVQVRSEKRGYIKTHSTCIPYLVAVGRPRRFVSCPHPCDHCTGLYPENIAIWRNALNFRRHLQVSSSQIEAILAARAVCADNRARDLLEMLLGSKAIKLRAWEERFQVRMSGAAAVAQSLHRCVISFNRHVSTAIGLQKVCILLASVGYWPLPMLLPAMGSTWCRSASSPSTCSQWESA